ncbi:glycoside hydrolase family 3 C-terminal domain-containing protein [Saccharothrix sp. S26]|uniref:glycoside hydrolase family 3 C-terminal domain-containing protein n=1 Tax=Saccharothrix sp. S26 TaxID=2907215 RepID=UPI001F44BE32|nr:glycoside hydrolase family 3 C-terminal domain-containing protein [Saccharothrix sp. S26]MCE6996623.1 glycoside hydrolase family 3 C-terminal domain-containing protein [Saccharothrix sp. S26]
MRRKVRLLTGATGWRTHDEPDVGLRSIVVSDGPIGVRGQGWDERSTSLALPSPTALAATWDVDLVRRLGVLLAAEARRKGVDVLLAPTLNLHRTPFGGRHFECFSEDPVLTAGIGAAYITGVQSGGVAATAKHYVANDSETERMTLNAEVDERTLHEVYLVPFEAAVRAGVWVVMSAYNGVNGVTMSESPLLDEPLKGTWGFDGLVVSDWGAVRSTAPSARAAQDLAMPGPRSPWNDLAAAVENGEVPESALDLKLERLLRLASRVGALNGSTPVTPQVEAPHDLLREAVAASTVLLRNDGVLPLSPDVKVAVLGPNAATTRIQGGGSAGVYPESVVSFVEGIAEVASVVHAPGVRLQDRPAPLTTANCRHPHHGEPGLLVRLLDVDGAELTTDHRLLGRVLEVPLVDRAHTVELHGELTVDVTGDWTISVAGFGRLTLDVAGVRLIDTDVPLDTDDPAVIHLTPPHRQATAHLEAGTTVDLVARRELREHTGTATVLAADPPRLSDADELSRAIDLARSSDVAVVVVGTTDEIESEGFDRTSLALPGRQDDLVRAIRAVNDRTVVVVNSGGPVELPWRDEVSAVLLTWFPGQEAGHGLADVLFGVREPGGRLPTTWPATGQDVPVSTVQPHHGTLHYSEGLHLGYRAWHRSATPPAYWFGHGLGYTTWSYEDATTTESGIRVRLRNTGNRPGREVVQVYVSRQSTTIDRPSRWLATWTTTTANPGQTTDVDLTIPTRAFQHWTPTGWTTEPGPFTLLIGPSSSNTPLTIQTTPTPTPTTDPEPAHRGPI